MKKHAIIPEAYSPLGSSNSPLLKDEDVVAIAREYSVDAGAVLLGYLCE